MRFFIIIILGISLFSCSSPEQELIGKWKKIKSIPIDQGVIETKTIYESEFLANGKIVNYYNGEPDKRELIRYKIYNDSLIATIIRGILDGVDTTKKELFFSITDDTLTIFGTNHSYSEYIRVIQ